MKAVPVLETKHKLKDILIICSSAIPDGQERTLVLGELYWRLGDTVSGLEYIKKATDLLYKRGEKEKATVYNSYALKNFTEYSLEDAKPEEFLDSVLMEFVAAGHLLPHEDQTNLLTKAQEVSRHHKE